MRYYVLDFLTGRAALSAAIRLTGIATLYAAGLATAIHILRAGLIPSAKPIIHTLRHIFAALLSCHSGNTA